jgi:hypothetical protein
MAMTTSNEHVPEEKTSGMGRRFMSTRAAAKHLGITAEALRMAVYRGTIRPSGRIGKRLVFSRADLDAQVRRGMGGSVAVPPSEILAPASAPVVAAADTSPAHDERRANDRKRRANDEARDAERGAGERAQGDRWGIRAAMSRLDDGASREGDEAKDGSRGARSRQRDAKSEQRG